ncbi:MAG: 1-deoxy-D-xylulose-5-phosphate synthase [Candidatus Zixiibacteriota bacterium]|nr:MAG: 1-deoxy-D-xylulose-5-phosphate synthase [candidate division Zixibacteria bacterium]
MAYLDDIKGPEDTKKLSVDQLTELAEEVRHEIISTVSKTGGHLASSLGAVELTVALHYIFNLPEDKIIWDVSHQTYGHKILSGRRDRMNTIRQYGGLAGFSKRDESEYDPYGAGHASTSISAALGFATARDHAGLEHKVIAVIGDGSMTGGLAFEGLNNAGHLKKDLLVILNDNTWSISKNVGAISKYLTSIMADEKFNKLRNEIWELTGRFKRRDKIRETISNIENSIKGLLVPGMLFQKLGFRYFGPIDGHDVPLLVKTLQDLKNLSGPIMLHIATVKGKGYEPAEENAFKYHGVGKFDKVTGEFSPSKDGRPNYTDVFGDVMLELAEKDNRVVAITAAMASGTGLVPFSEKFPERFFDVGIAEGHAGCFAAGLAAEKMKPYLVVYSTFMQRAFDQVVHDIALQKLPVVICMDRGGLVGNDGPTHHGTFDLSYLSAIPGIVVAAPKDGNELRAMLHYTVDNELPGPVAIRYPRDIVPTEMKNEIDAIDWGEWEGDTGDADVFLLAVGTMYMSALRSAVILEDRGLNVAVINARFVKPFDQKMLATIRGRAKVIVTLEENQLRGGFGQAVADYLLSSGYQGKFKALGLPDSFVTHGNRDQLLTETGLDIDTIVMETVALAGHATNGTGLIQKLFSRRNGQVPSKPAPGDDRGVTIKNRKSG